jgi:hypothetical protein
MDITVCMIVKDEERHVEQCIAPLRDVFPDFIVVDTGSTDGTRGILRDRFGITALDASPTDGDSLSLTAARNQAYERAGMPWILCIDADERLTADDARRLAGMPDDPGSQGYFFHWRTEVAGGPDIEDYKLSLFRRGARKAGAIHETAQPDFRARGWVARWLDGVTLRHLPDAERRERKRALYLDALRKAAAADPAWLRYHWFLGHDLYRSGHSEEARGWLEQCFAGRSSRFPVESLNAAMLLAAIAVRRGDEGGALAVLAAARSFHDLVRDDFEVAVNFRLRPWLDAAEAAIREGHSGRIEPYAFPY